MKKRGRTLIKKCSKVLKICFNKDGHDTFIDYIKAYSIICVLLGHTLYFLRYYADGLWLNMQVPLFILIQTFHAYKKETSSFNFKKIFFRIILPFLVVQVVVFSFMYCDGVDGFSLLKDGVFNGGFGPGSYYPWVFIQIAIALPVFRCVFERYNKWFCIILMLLLCECLEVLASITDMPDSIYRLLAIRYLFLLYLGWLWVKEGFVVSVSTIVLSILSALAIMYFEYYSIDDECFFYTTGWKYHRWPCYFYVSCLFCFILYKIYKIFSRFDAINIVTVLLAKCSYEIFLVQMAIIVILGRFEDSHLVYLGRTIRVSLIFIVSILGGYFLNKIYNRWINNNRQIS